MVDLDAAIGFVVAHGDAVERARLSWLRAGATPSPELLDSAEVGQTPTGGWPAVWGTDLASVDATCFRLAELDDLGALGRPAARRALDWLASRQQADGGWEEDAALADDAPWWARPGDPEARLYLTATVTFWLTVADLDAARAAAPPGRWSTHPPDPRWSAHPPDPRWSAHPPDPRWPAGPPGQATGSPHAGNQLAGNQLAGDAYAGSVQAGVRALVGQLQPDGTFPSYLAVGWLSAAVFHQQELFYESARIQVALADRMPKLSPANAASLAAALRRVGVDEQHWTLVAARRRLTETQRSDGGWESDDGHQFDVHTTLAAIRACR
ncbi:prenyltransferase/squalene oxidase repeat-containing protein [Micromonospora sp. WMMD712]|uniref:prenyltransferase/squalene oxidase repeat-containing protein n=1 Tax=Micromonospora sp. WMMD712 TaxID=3016096 RepID=UPI002499DE12|nr:prenyltransferase/squalene oxidase repeat-containing protein [Micromonospora sp. WMMD712]WFE58124.1 prenyltransferase/squalene oxidase repeat-containing protein [Micromonospora sp. WMMD712]